MSVRPPTYKKNPYSIQFYDMAADWVRDYESRKKRGVKRCPDLSPSMLDTAVRAGLTHTEIRSALGISPNTLTNASKRTGIVLPKTAAERTAFLASAPLTALPPATTPLPSADGIVSAWLADVEAASTAESHDALNGTPDALPTSKQGTRSRVKFPQMVEAVAKRMVGDAACRLIPGTYTARDGYESCDGLIGKGPDARPTVFAWREKASEVEEVLKVYREVHAEVSLAATAQSATLKN